MTQVELAEKAGLGRMTIVRLERGGTDAARPSTIRKLARALKVKPQEID